MFAPIGAVDLSVRVNGGDAIEVKEGNSWTFAVPQSGSTTIEVTATAYATVVIDNPYPDIIEFPYVKDKYSVGQYVNLYWKRKDTSYNVKTFRYYFVDSNTYGYNNPESLQITERKTYTVQFIATIEPVES